MHDGIPALLQSWTNFYVIVGSSAGALTGLQFVVMALVSQARATGGMSEIRAFGSPTVVHFCAVLFISAAVTAPWHTIHSLAVNLVVLGAAGAIYILNALRHALQAKYRPDMGDWFWFSALPLASYLAVFLIGLMLVAHPEVLLYLLGGVALVLLYTGIHNAWDTVTYIAVRTHSKDSKSSEP